jgi:O-6-methylguanine DNA methyltransferase
MQTRERRWRYWTSASVAPEIIMHIARTERGICRASFTCSEPEFERELGDARRDSNDRILCDAVEQLRAYFRRQLRAFELPLDLEGTAFQRRVWDALLEIPYGETRTYADIAMRIGAPKALRAVGAANGRNPAPVIVPCHRVIQTGGGLGGYSGGLRYKRALLGLERGDRVPAFSG